MKQQTALNWLIPIIAILAIITSSTGLFLQGGEGPFPFTTVSGEVVEIYGQGLYHNDSRIAAAGFKGTDAITLFLSVPLLLVTYAFYRRGSLRGSVLMLGMLLYFLYNGASYSYSAAFNSMFLVYAALFSSSLFATIIAFTSFELQDLSDRISSKAPRRGMAIFMLVAGIGTFGIWMSEVVGPLLSGQAPANLGPYTTMFTHSFDSAVITPAAILAGILLLQRKPLGYLLAAPLHLLCTLIGIVVIAQTVSQTLMGFVFPLGVYIGMIGSWIVMGTFAVGLTFKFLRSISK